MKAINKGVTMEAVVVFANIANGREAPKIKF
jgi:hypothetical protein